MLKWLPANVIYFIHTLFTLNFTITFWKLSPPNVFASSKNIAQSFLTQIQIPKIPVTHLCRLVEYSKQASNQQTQGALKYRLLTRININCLLLINEYIWTRQKLVITSLQPWHDRKRPGTSVSKPQHNNATSAQQKINQNKQM